jgi:hypothetical protein
LDFPPLYPLYGLGPCGGGRLRVDIFDGGVGGLIGDCFDLYSNFISAISSISRGECDLDLDRDLDRDLDLDRDMRGDLCRFGGVDSSVVVGLCICILGFSLASDLNIPLNR